MHADDERVMKPFAWLLVFVLTLLGAPLGAQDLVLKASDVRVSPRDDGLHLIVRQIPGLSSVMLTEAFELPDHRLATYSWKGLAPNAQAAEEKRLLDGKFLKGPNVFLISSTVVADPLFGPAFEVLIPPVIEYGSATLPNSRYGRIDVAQELSRPGGRLWFSIRTFAKPYLDYTGTYKDNAFELSAIVSQAQVLPPEGSYYVKGNEDLFNRLGRVYKAVDAAAGVAQLKTLFVDHTDLVVLVDETKSMTVDLKALQTDLLPVLADTVGRLEGFRLGLVEYRDYGELWTTRVLGLSANPEPWAKRIAQAEAVGGGDIPEAVVEALDTGLGLFDPGSTAKRVVVVFGDAPQHDSPRGKVLESEVVARAQAMGVEIHAILLPVTPY